MSLAIDGTAANSTGSGTSLACTLTTTFSDVVLLFVEMNAGGSDNYTVSSTTSAGWTTPWTIRNNTLNDNHFDEYYGVPGAPLSSEVITVSTDTGATFISICAFGVSGANNSSPFDTNASIPATSASGAVTGISTSNANDMLILGARQNGDSNPTAISFGSNTGTQINGANYLNVCYAVVSSTQSSISTTGGDTSDQNGAIVDAIIAASGGGSTPQWRSLMGVGQRDNMWEKIAGILRPRKSRLWAPGVPGFAI